jgi:hypothetical protein
MKQLRLRAIVSGMFLMVGSCSSSSPGTTGSAPTAVVEGSSYIASPATVPHQTPVQAVDAATAVTGDPGPICDTIPGMGTISAAVGETMTTAKDISNPTQTIGEDVFISQKCDVSGDGFAVVQFERWDLKQGQATLAPSPDSPDLIQDISFPELPGAIAWANNVVIEHEGLYYAVFAATPQSIGVDNSPEGYAAGAALLKAWINA